MFLESISLQNFRNYSKREFKFSPKLTLIIGSNTSGKTNILEAIYLLAAGKSFRAKVEREMILHEQELARVKCEVRSEKWEDAELEIVLTTGIVQNKKAPYKKYLVNGVGKRKANFVGNFYAVLFNPQDIELVTDSPSTRRAFLDNVLTQTSSEYAQAIAAYEKGLRRRNKILQQISEKKANNRIYIGGVSENINEQLEYWNKLLVENGKLIIKHREKLIRFLNTQKLITIQDKYVRASNSNNKEEKEKEDKSKRNINKFEQFNIEYDNSEISKERLKTYAEREMAAGYTLVGPHRDDFVVRIKTSEDSKYEEKPSVKGLCDVSAYGSRGEQRLAVLWLKLGELAYLEEKIRLRRGFGGQGRPILLLDDIFSELDHEHRELVTRIIPEYQTVITTADEHYVEGLIRKNSKGDSIKVIRLNC